MVLAALVAAALPAPRWGFEGFLPRKGRERRERLARIALDDRATVLFEAPTRVAATLGELAAACGDGRAAAVARELTKVHEETLRGRAPELLEVMTGRRLKGELVLVLQGRGKARRKEA